MYRYIPHAVVLFSIMIQASSAATSYAVLGYEMNEKNTADKISAFVTERVEIRTGSKVISSTNAKSLLKEANCNSTQHSTGRKYCQTAGDILGVDYVIYGKAKHSGTDIIVESYMIDTSSGNTVGHALARENPKDAMLFSKSIDQSIVRLIGLRKMEQASSIQNDKMIGGSSDTVWYKRTPSPWLQTVMDHVEIGFRFSHFGLFEDTERHYNDEGVFIGGYLGSISTLETQQNYFPSIYANIIIRDWVVLQFGYERFEADAVTYWDGHRDGTFIFNGPSLVAQFRYKNASRFTPYAGAGFAMLNADFDMLDWWHNGFGNPEPEEAYQRWVDSGAPDWPNGGYQRNLTVSEDLMFKPILQGGCYWHITDNISLDMDMRYISLDAELDYTLSRYGTVFQDAGTTEFPMDAWIFDLGMTFNF